ncbi:MAG: type II toxin-antitoxin system prevent-host-death family antitoxin [Acidaminococcaceae bacterium]|jgi:PHD/YefM family antitoxin component YafN of YafNO toxin-antitoxin module|nr:type II toxin-antitoxin system prevent-host-death family antitoxin [Acidaminococcaceae bacterium]
MKKENKEILIPMTHTVTEFSTGKAPKIFKEIVVEDQVVIVVKNSKPQNVIISYDRYLNLKKGGANI